MADTKYSALTGVTAVAAANEWGVNEAGASKKASAAQVKTFVNDAPVFAAGGTGAGTKPKLTTGTLMTAAESGALELESGVPYISTPTGRGVWPSEMIKLLGADATGTNGSSAQPWFPTAGAISLQASTIYRFEGWFSSARTAGTTSHTTGTLFGGTATLNAIRYWVNMKEGDAATYSDGDLAMVAVATDTVAKVASTSATENIVFSVRGIVWINAAGTLIPQFKYSAAPGGAPTIHRGTHFVIWPIGTGSGAVTVGPWA